MGEFKSLDSKFTMVLFNPLQTELVDLREHSTEAQSVKFEADSKIRQLESSLDDKTSEVEKLNVRIEEVGYQLYICLVGCSK